MFTITVMPIKYSPGDISCFPGVGVLRSHTQISRINVHRTSIRTLDTNVRQLTQMRGGRLLIHAVNEMQWVTTSSARTNNYKQNRFLFVRYKKTITIATRKATRCTLSNIVINYHILYETSYEKVFSVWSNDIANTRYIFHVSPMRNTSPKVIRYKQNCI